MSGNLPGTVFLPTTSEDPRLSDGTLSLRERIMRHLCNRFTERQRGETRRAVDGSTIVFRTTWNTVSRKPLHKDALRLGAAVALFEGAEQKARETGTVRATLPVIVEFYDTLQEGDDPATLLKMLLTDVQHCVLLDPQCGGLTLDIQEIRNELSIDGPSDRTVAGMVEFAVVYRPRASSPMLPREGGSFPDDADPARSTPRTD